MAKHAYLIISHDNFKVLEVCLKMIDDERNDIFLLFDKKSKISYEQKQYFCSLIKKSNLKILKDMTINWAGASQIWAELELLKEANVSDQYDYVHFLQGVDLPIKTQDEIHAFFAKNDYEFVNIDKGLNEMARRKAQYRHFFSDNRFFRKNRFVKCLNFGFFYLQKIFHIRRNIDIQLYQGSALFSITGKCAKFLQDNEKEIRKRFKKSLACDEVFIQTILMKSIYCERIKNIEKNISSNARLIDRMRPDGRNSPHIWRTKDWEEIISQPEDICFARKFNEVVDFEVVKKLYKKIKGEDFVEGVK